MILSRKLNRLGCINREFSSKNIQDSFIFLDNIFSRIKQNQEIGITITCIEIPQNLIVPNFELVEEESDSSSLVWEIFRFLKTSGHRLCFFLPTHFFLGSQLPDVVENTQTTITNLSSLLDQFGIDEPSIFLRVGSAYGARKSTMDRFCSNVGCLDKKVVRKIAVCNDEKPSLFSVTDLLSGVFYSSNLPIVFRFLPHQFNAGGLSIREALFLAVSTWPEGTTPVFIHSESSEVDSNGLSLSPVPSQFLKHRIPTFGLDIDIVLDSPAEYRACVKYKNELISLKPIVINKIDKK